MYGTLQINKNKKMKKKNQKIKHFGFLSNTKNNLNGNGE
jgi:hypothetical protein